MRQIFVLGLAAIGLATCSAAETQDNPVTAVAHVNGGRIEYVVTGPEDGEPILLIHGAGLADAYLPIAAEPALADYRKIIMHRRGYAGSSPVEPADWSEFDPGDPDSNPQPHYPFSEQAADALALVRSLGHERVHVSGHSAGGAVALAMALAHPETVASLALLEPAIPPSEEDRLAWREAVRALVLSQLARIDAGEPLSGPDTLFAATVPGGLEQATADARAVADVEFPALLSDVFGEEEARRLAPPLLWAHGDSTAPMFLDGAARMKAWRPEIETSVIEGAGHVLLVTHPEEIARLMADFFARHPM